MEHNKTLKNLTAIQGTHTYLFAILANLSVNIFASGIVVFSGNEELAKVPMFNFVMMLLIQAAFFIVIYLLVLNKGYSMELKPVGSNQIKGLIFAPLFALLCILAFYAPTIWFGELLDKIGYTITPLSEMSTPLEYFLGLSAMIVIAPFVEELLFRGVLLNALREKTSDKNAVILAALAFMLMHMNPAQTIYQFLFGLVLGAAAIITGSVLVPMLIHACSNTIAFLLDYSPLGAIAESFINLVTANIFLCIFVSIMFFGAFSAAIIFVFMHLSPKRSRGEIKAEMKVLAVKPVYSSDGGTVYLKVDDSKKVSPYKKMYALAAGVCVFMWVVALIISITTEV